MDRRVSVLVASIPHTGTFFLLDSVFRNFNFQIFERSPIPGSKQYRHLFNDNDEQLLRERMQQCVTVVPVRKYDHVVKTWRRNGMDARKLENYWAKMVAMRDVFHLQIDAYDRDDRLLKLSEIIGEKLQTDWKPVNSMNFGAV